MPINTSDPIAIVNKEVITRERLASECVARKGEEILETLISRTLIDQWCSAVMISGLAVQSNIPLHHVSMRTNPKLR